jgi:hypothetical protein
MAKGLSNKEIGKALREPSYLDAEGSPEGYGGLKDLVPLLKVLRYKALKNRGAENCNGQDV